jgi:hypothetical protein
MAYYFGDTLGQTYAGFPPANIAAYFGVSRVAATGIINLANGHTLTDAQKDAILMIGPRRFKPGATGPHQGYGDITWGLAHLAQHPMGSHYHGGVGNIFKNIALNMATGGLYQVAKSGLLIAKGGKVLPNVKTAMAAWGPAGNILQPAIGTNKTLALESLVAGGALALAAKAGALPGMTGTVAPTALKTATPLLIGPSPGAVPSGLDPRYNPGYESTPLSQQYNPASAYAGFGPNIDPTTGQPVAEAGFLGGLSPLALVALFGVPLALQLFTKGRKTK